MKFISQEQEFTLLIGRGLSAFGRVEMALAEIFTIAAQCADPNLAERVFWSVNSLDARTAMTRAALKCVYPRLKQDSSVRPMWTEIAREIKAQASKRAELAHGNYLGVFWLGKRGGKHQDQFFAPYYGKTTAESEDRTRRPKRDPRPPKRLYIPDLEARITDFISLEMKATKLIAHLAYELHQAGPPKEPAVRHLFQPTPASASQKQKETSQRRKPKPK